MSAHKPFRELSLENVHRLGEGTDIWKIRADRIYVEGKPNVMKWVAEAWPARPDNWADMWVFGAAFRL